MEITRIFNVIFVICIASKCECIFLKNVFPSNFNIRNMEHVQNFDLNAMLNYVTLSRINDFSKEICINNVTMEPEAYMTTVEIIQNRGYPAETHTVQTEDGYILELHRIPHGLSGPSANRPPVFLQHGVFSQSGDWIVNFGNQSLGYMFADVGYDVWLGNYRGNTYSRKHVSLDPDIDKEEFWNFSFQENGNYDLSASIDYYILNETRFQQLTYVGHSMGTTAFFQLMANRTEYNAKIKIMIALAPSASIYNTSSHQTSITENINHVETIFNALGYYEVLPHTDLLTFLASSVCSSPDPVICENVIQSVGGLVPDTDQLNTTRIPVYAAHTPAGSSTKGFYHYAQLVNDPQVFRAYNYGRIKNLEIYGQDPPPAYDLGKVTAPVALFWGQNDKLAISEDVAFLDRSLPNVVLNYRIDNDLWHHLDFIWAIEAEFYQNTRIIEFVLSRE